MSQEFSYGNIIKTREGGRELYVVGTRGDYVLYRNNANGLPLGKQYDVLKSAAIFVRDMP